MRILVGAGTCGLSAGASQVIKTLKEELLKNGLAHIEVLKTGCIGMCFCEVLIEIDDNGQKRLYGNVTPERACTIIKKDIIDSEPINEWLIDKSVFLKRQKRIALRNCGNIVPDNIDDYISSDGYKAVSMIIEKNLDSQDIISEIEKSGLKGRGGGGFPTAIKWKAANAAENKNKYLICNADEGDPGAFMDRSILEGDPHSVIEGMLIGAKAIGANHGYIYVRAEYPLAIERLNTAIAQARERGFLGNHFDITIKEGAGAFVCGEETALIASIEGKRGMPRVRPPYPAQSGLWEKPTCINNVETFANIPWIMLNGGEQFASFGVEGARGTKVFATAGKIAKPGLVEVEMGMTISEIVNEIGGGIRDGGKFKAVQMGGPSGGCIPKHLAETPIDYANITATGAIMGSGGMIVMDENTCMVELARFFLAFTQEESCGKCTFCRIGTKRMLEILEKITKGEGQETDIERLEELAMKIKQSSLCGLGQSAPNPVLTTIRYFKDEYLSHTRDKKCPAKQCRNLITYSVNQELCKHCGMCLKKCPAKTISVDADKVYTISQEGCIKCGKCFEVCKFKSIMRD